MTARILVTRRGGVAEGVTTPVVRTRARRMLAALELSGAELSILLTDDATIHELNAQYRDKDRPTDVLAFAMREGETSAREAGAHEVLGDVVLSLDTARRQAPSHRHDVLAEVTMLLAHGVLHLVGYDHETDAEEREMQAMTRKLVRAATTGPGPKPRAKRPSRAVRA